MNKHRILVRNANIVDPYQNREWQADILVEDGVIAACETKLDVAKDSLDKLIDADNKLVMPSFIDSNVHLREPGFERKATFVSELAAAASAGVGHLLCVPTCQPTIDSPALAQSIIEKAKCMQAGKVYPLGAITKSLKGKHLSEMKSLMDAGCIALTNYYHAYEDLNVLIRCYQYAATFDIPVFIYPQMPSLYRDGGIHDGEWSARLGLPAIPETAETIAIATQLLLVEQTGVKAHFSQISCKRSVEQLAEAKARGLNISVDVAAHQLFLDDSCVQSYDSHYHVCPPLRSREDRLALIQGLKDGVIDSLCSSHQPHEAAAKHLPFPASEPGISAIETLLPLAGRLQEQGLSTLALAACLSSNAARNFGIKQSGIETGAQADFVIIDTKTNWQLSADKMRSAGKNTPFLGEEFKWRVSTSIFDGQLVFESQD